MPLVRSNDAPDSADPVRCASPPCFKPSTMLFFPPNRVSSDESRPRSLPRRANGAPGPYPAADIASSPRVASVLAPSVADARRLSRITRRSGAIFGLVPSTGAPPHDAHPGSPGGGFGGSSYGGGGSYGGDTRETQQYTDYQCVRSPVLPQLPTLRARWPCAVALNCNGRPSARLAPIAPEIASRPTPTRLFPARTGTWVTAASSARAAAPWSA